MTSVEAGCRMLGGQYPSLQYSVDIDTECSLSLPPVLHSASVGHGGGRGPGAGHHHAAAGGRRGGGGGHLHCPAGGGQRGSSR